MKNLEGRVAAVTGAAHGIGRCVALELARAGMDLALADIDETGLQAVRSEIEALGRRCIAVKTDVRDKAQLERLLERCLGDLGGAHVIVNNAGLFHAGSLLECGDAEFERVIDTNLWGVVHGSRIFGRHFVAQRMGHIVNVASAAGLVGAPGMTSYSTSKFGVVGFSEVLRWELASQGIGVSMVCPGILKTDIARREHVGLSHLDFDRFLRFAPQPELLARRIVAAIRRDRALVTLGLEANVARVLRRLPYAIQDAFGKRVARQTDKVIRPRAG